MAADLLPRAGARAPRAPRRILVAHHLLLGDTLMLTPLLAKCRALWPDAELVMTCPPPFVGLYATAPYGVRVLPYDPADVASLGGLRREPPFDLALVTGDNRLQWLARALGARWIVAFAGDSPALEGLARRRAAPLPGRADGLGRPLRAPRRRSRSGALRDRRLAATAGRELPAATAALRACCTSARARR